MNHSILATALRCWLAVLLALLASGCGARLPASPTVPAPVHPSARGYEHRLAMNYSMLCEYPAGRLRCRGFHPIGEEAEAWMPYSEGFSNVTLSDLAVCGLREGRVFCWGEDPTQLRVSHGADLSAPYCSPNTFHGLMGVRELAMADGSGCVITADGRARCWGSTLANEDPEDMLLYDVAENARGLAVGAGMGCALSDAGIRCWGEPVGRPMDARPLPLGESYEVRVPQPVQVVVGESFACARSADQRVFCWGYDIAGTLGMGPDDGDDHFRPRQIPALRAVDLVAGESAVCARAEDGKSYCWGDNHAGQLGLGHTRVVDVPTHVPALDGAVDVVLAAEALCARFPSADTRCAGDLTPLLSDVAADVMSPQRLPGGPVSRLLLSEREACVLRAEALTCYGDGGYLRRGHQEAAAGWELNDMDEPLLTQVSTDSTDVSCRRWGTGRVRCDSTDGSGAVPPVEVMETHALASAGSSVCVISRDRKVLCWTRGRADSRPTEVPGIADAASLALVSGRGCAVTTQGAVQCWTADPRLLTQLASPPTSLTDARSLALHADRTCVLRRGGELACWDGQSPQGGDITGVTELAVLSDEMCVVQAGLVRCFRFDGRDVVLGDPVPGVTHVVELASGGAYACARSENSEVHCWGRNRRSQLGVLAPMLRLALTEIPSTVVEPEHPATFECGPI